MRYNSEWLSRLQKKLSLLFWERIKGWPVHTVQLLVYSFFLKGKKDVCFLIYAILYSENWKVWLNHMNRVLDPVEHDSNISKLGFTS